MPDESPDQENPETRREVTRVRRHLLIYFGVGLVGLGIAVAWAARSLPEGGLPDPYAVGGGTGLPTLPAQCAKFGEQCTHSPGKLGTCIHREGCTGAGCLFCQSQH